MRSNPFEHISRRGEVLSASDIHIVDVIIQQNAAILANCGKYGTPGATRTHYIPLRRRALYPGEVQGHVLNFPRTEDGLLIIRRRTLYPGEVRGLKALVFYPICPPLSTFTLPFCSSQASSRRRFLSQSSCVSPSSAPSSAPCPRSSSTGSCPRLLPQVWLKYKRQRLNYH